MKDNLPLLVTNTFWQIFLWIFETLPYEHVHFARAHMHKKKKKSFYALFKSWKLLLQIILIPFLFLLGYKSFTYPKDIWNYFDCEEKEKG